jgi:hypothetical protein
VTAGSSVWVFEFFPSGQCDIASLFGQSSSLLEMSICMHGNFFVFCKFRGIIKMHAVNEEIR